MARTSSADAAADSNFLDASRLCRLAAGSARSRSSRSQKACETIRTAIEADQKSEWAEALRLYKVRQHDVPRQRTEPTSRRQNSLDYFSLALKVRKSCGASPHAHRLTRRT